MRSTHRKPPRTPETPVRTLGPRFHTPNLPGGLRDAVTPQRPAELSGTRVPDLGCTAGFRAVELARRGARRARRTRGSESRP